MTIEKKLKEIESAEFYGVSDCSEDGQTLTLARNTIDVLLTALREAIKQRDGYARAHRSTTTEYPAFGYKNDDAELLAILENGK